MQNTKKTLAVFQPIGEKLLTFLKRNPVLSVALVAALITALFVPPDLAYLDYFDFKTLTCLFCVLAVVCALKNIHFFSLLAEQIVALFNKYPRVKTRGISYAGKALCY